MLLENLGVLVSVSISGMLIVSTIISSVRPCSVDLGHVKNTCVLVLMFVEICPEAPMSRRQIIISAAVFELSPLIHLWVNSLRSFAWWNREIVFASVVNCSVAHVI